MADDRNKSTKRKKRGRAGNLEGITPSDALEILHILYDRDPAMTELIEHIVEEHLKAFDIPGMPITHSDLC